MRAGVNWTLWPVGATDHSHLFLHEVLHMLRHLQNEFDCRETCGGKDTGSASCTTNEPHGVHILIEDCRSWKNGQSITDRRLQVMT